ncbi:MAG: aminotransferase class IV [Candidatus Omnitrophica bacterium]|nr:aminotransferase class IV [Candidatus Omnitrophota bacterium]
MKEIIFLNGRFLNYPQAKVSVLDPGFLYGFGLFETMRAKRGRIIYLNAHLSRIKASCVLLGLAFPYSPEKTKKIIGQAIDRSGLADAYVRLTLWKQEQGAGVCVMVKRYRPYPQDKYKKGIKITVSSLRQAEGSSLARIKSANRLLFELSYLEARKKGFDGSLILNNRGYVSESSRSNIFFVKDGQIFTPALSCGCLDGITRRGVFTLAEKDKIKVNHGKFTLDDFYAADEVFLSNSLAGIMPVAYIDKTMIGDGRCGKITQQFITRYNSLLK